MDEYHVSPNLARGLPQGYAVVQSNAPAKLDLIRLDHVHTASFPAFAPPVQERRSTTGVDLRTRTIRARCGIGSPTAPIARMASLFDGA